MLRAFLFLSIFVLLVFQPVVFAKGKDNDGQEKNHFRFEIEINGQDNSSPSPTPTPTTSPFCDPGANWKNHGAYVSCVARFEPGPHRLGGKGNSVAAKSSVGKKAPGPTATPSATPEPTPTATPSATPTATPSATASPSANVQVEIEAQGPLSQVIAFIEQILLFLRGLLP